MTASRPISHSDPFGKIQFAESEVPSIEYRTVTISDGGVTEQVCQVGGVRRFMLRTSPALLSPLFALCSGSELITTGLHHNSKEFGQRYSSLLESARRLTVDVQLSEGSRLFLVGGHSNFYHFVTNYLARIYYYTEFHGGSAADKYLVSSNLPLHYYQYFERLGVSSEQLVLVPANAYNCVTHLCAANLPHYMSDGLRGDKPAFEWLRNKLGCERGSQLGRRFILLRGRASHRRIVNEDVLLEIGARFGFEPIYPEDYGVGELLDLLGQADVLVTPFGAGATNSLFCSARCAIVEIVGRTAMGKQNCPVLCALADQRCIRIGATELDLGVAWPYRDLYVDTGDFKRALLAAIG